MARGPMRILTWHIHGNYLFYLSHARQEFFVPIRPGRPEGYAGRSGTLPWPDNLHEVPADRVRDLPLDAVLFQSRRNYVQDQYEILSDAQRRLPRIYLEHDPPREHPTDTRHVVDDPEALLVHCTAFNELMWDNGRTPTRVIPHGVTAPAGVRYSGELERGVVVINHLSRRGRRLGADVFERVRRRVPLDLIGMGSEEMGGLGEVQHGDLPAFLARYRFLFNPIRWTSLGLAVCEAMMIGLPVIGLAATEMAVAVENGVSGCVDTDIDALVERMQELLADPDEARVLGRGARRAAEARFGIERFAQDWDDAFAHAAGTGAQPRREEPSLSGAAS